MSNFIERTDYDAALHREILSSLLRETSAGGQPSPDYNPQVIEACEDNAIALMRSYLSNSYDCEAIFSAQGSGATSAHPYVCPRYRCLQHPLTL